MPSPSFLSTVKSSPEEWYQVVSDMKMRAASMIIEPVYCHLFIPGGRVFGLTDKVSFHIQLTGALDSLQKLLMPQAVDAPAPAPWSSKKKIDKCPLHSKPKIKVHILRQYTVDSNGKRAIQDKIIGEGEIWEVPPAICEAAGAVHLDWEGELKIDGTVTIGGFVAGNVSVKDSVVLTVIPPTVDHQPSPFLSLQMSIPIRVVTDSYVEVTEYEPTAAVP
ncbi:hypothetical protein DXG03_007683 [Asterophora parasitica]|uniref:Uncharacterized protein n=1 Tax=Asterophora parasitica TaxID=117018 RepID=A0A9P7KDD8_9AGAR|nr:hypothetical protein DXG03_007683 [Asterophora parasitica]